MEGKYSVLLDHQEVGTVQLIRQGLYYRIVCRCKLPEDTVYKLEVRCADQHTHIGVPVPEGDGFTLDKRLPVKHLGQGTPEFYLTSPESRETKTFVPISPEEPFGYIERLQDAYLEERNGKQGILIDVEKEEEQP